MKGEKIIMSKLFTKIAALALGATMAVGVGVAVVSSSKTAESVQAADSTVTFTMKNFGGITANSYQNSAVAGTGSNSAGGTIAASSYAFNGSTGQVRGNKTAIAGASPSSDSNKNWHLFNTAAIPGAIKSIVVSTSSATSSNRFKGTLYVALGTSSKGSTTTVSGATSATPTASSGSYANTFTFSGLNSSSSYTYFKIMSNVAFTAGSVTNVSVVVTYVSSYSVTKNATNCTISGAATVDGSKNEDFTITPSTNYDAPQAITVKAGSTTLTQNTHYSYYVTDYIGYMTLYKSAQTANITITAAGVAQLTVTDSVTHGSLSSTAKIHSGEELDVTINPDSGYTYPTSVTVTMGGSPVAAEYNSSDGTLYYTPVTGNIVVTATCPAAGNTYSITTNVTNGTYSGDTTITDNGGVASVTIAPTGDYKLPTSVSVSGADHTYNASTGVISLSNATGNVTISAAMVALTEYSITVNETNGSHTGASTIKESRTASLTFEPDSGYGQPASVTVTGATYTWTRGTGVLSLSNPTGNVSVTYEAVGNELDSITLSANSGNYILGDDFIKPTVTAHYTAAAAADVTSSATFTGYDPYTTGNQTVTVSYTEGGITKTASYTANVSAKPVGYSYNKISSVSDIAEGDYIIAYSTYGFDNRDAASGYTTVTISNDSIAQSAAMDKLAVHITPVSGGYTLQVSATSDDNAGKYINYTTGGGSNTLKFEDSAQTIPISLVSSSSFATHASGGAFAIGSTDNVLAWNNNSGNYRYRFYKVATTTDDHSSSKPGLNYFAPDLYKKVSSGTADLIRITATYTGGEKYVGDPIHTTDFAVKKQLNTGNELFDVASGYTISANTLTSTSNTITVSYTENNITKTVDVVVPATERSATVTSVTLVQGQGVVKDYIDWSGTAWNYTGLTVHCLWSDSTYEDFNLADLIQAGDATVSPVKPAVGVTSFTVSYAYHEVAITSNTVTGISVVADYVTNISWTGTSASQFKAFSGGQLTAEQVGAWSVVPTLAGAGEQSPLSFGDYTLKVGTKTISSLPYTWVSEDDGQELSITYGKDAAGNDFVKKNATAVGNICATINAIDHDETTTGDQTIALDMTDQSAYSKIGTSGTGSETEITLSSFTVWTDKGYAADGESMRVYSGGEFKITSENTIKSVSFTFTGGKTGLTGGTDLSTNEYTETASAQARVVTITIEFEGSVTTTVHYANQMEHFDAQKKVVEFAKFMNTTMNGTNVCSGTFANLEFAWGTVADKYDELFGADTTLNATELAWAKNMFKYATAVWGSDAEPACVEKAMKTYDYCVGKYGLDPFMDGVRSAERAGNINPITIIGNKSDVNVIAIVVITSVVSLTAIGGYFFLRKRKENI